MQRCSIPLSAVLIALLATSATAAVRKCSATVSGDIASAPTALEAKKKALSQWRVQALQAGLGFDSWRLADGRALKCSQKASGYECVAVGAPCIIDQSPATPPNLPTAKGGI